MKALRNEPCYGLTLSVSVHGSRSLFEVESGGKPPHSKRFAPSIAGFEKARPETSKPRRSERYRSTAGAGNTNSWRL
jgi:hypothetical protein